jgi:GNAT superfamily N-acetyltransferase
MTSPAPPGTGALRIRRVDDGCGALGALVDGLAAVLVDCVEGGASVGFMLPLSADRARRYWADTLAEASRGGRIVLVAEEADDGAVLGTVQVVPAVAENQPHRADIAKLLVHRRARRRGVAQALVAAAESAALDAGRTLLVLDTADAGAERLYARLGWRRVGVIPDFAHWPGGGLTATTLFFKAHGPVAPGAGRGEAIIG